MYGRPLAESGPAGVHFKFKFPLVPSLKGAAVPAKGPGSRADPAFTVASESKVRSGASNRDRRGRPASRWRVRLGVRFWQPESPASLASESEDGPHSRH